MRYNYVPIKASLDGNGLRFYDEWDEKPNGKWDMPILMCLANLKNVHPVYAEAAFFRLKALNFVREMELCDRDS